jgi:hypothetical protein
MPENRRTICWQGWKLQIPRRWDPVKLEGNHSEGYALFADALRPRLGLRWQTQKKNTDPATAVKTALKNEVGQLAAGEATPLWSLDQAWQTPLLYIEPQPPGRDVFSAASLISNRLLQVAYHAHRREHILAQTILPTLSDLPVDRAVPWSVFDLNCVIPGNMPLRSHRLNAGDLGLTFADRFHELTLRQIAVAQLALTRQPLDAWITDQQKTARRYHKPSDHFSDTTVQVGDRELSGRRSQMHRRLRYSILWNQPPVLTTLALHDRDRDRLILLHGSDEPLLREIARTIANPPSPLGPSSQAH